MEITIIAIAPNDGWAFITKENEVYLLRPPYTSTNHIIKATQKNVQNALHLHSFEECDQSFGAQKEVIDFLKDKYVEAIKNRGIDLPSKDELGESLKYATDDILLKLLERAEKEWIPKGKRKAASSIALDIMKLEKTRSNTEIHKMAVSVLEKCGQEEREMEELAQEVGNQQETWKDRFPRAIEKYSAEDIDTRTKLVRENKAVLQMVA